MIKYELLYLPLLEITTRCQLFDSLQDAFNEALRMESAGEIYPDAWEISKVSYIRLPEEINKEELKDAAAGI